MNKLKFLISVAVMLTVFGFTSVMATEVINIKHSTKDMTPIVRAAIENAKEKDIKLVFEKGDYKFMPDYAFSKYCFITNHENGYKRIIFPFFDFNSVEVEGNGSEFIFHGQVAPFVFENCNSVKAQNFTIDWDIPFLFQGEVMAVNPKEGWRDIKPATEGFSWKLQRGRVTFPNIDEFKFSSLGSNLEFEKDPKRVAHGAYDFSSRPSKVEKRPNGVLRIYEHKNQFPTVGNIENFKGPKGENRYAPAFHCSSSNNIHFDHITIHHALGMGFLLERCDTGTISNSGIYVREGSERVVSIIADATHFCNCKGHILVENCRFEQMLDDGTNVHGTYVEVNKVIDEYTLRYQLKHFQQYGFKFADKGDEMWFIHTPSPAKKEVDTVASVKIINDHFADITFENKLPANLKKGDILENKTWNPTFTLKGCTIQNHRARNIVLKTPLKTVIEDNYFSSMMSAILFRGETFYWYESGIVEDVTIRNNHFDYVAYSGSEHAVMYITPRLGKAFDQTECYDRNIVFEDNIIETFDNRIVWADRAEGLIIRSNTIKKNGTQEQLYPDAPLFQLDNCKDVQIIKNKYEGDYKEAVKADEKSAKTLKVKGNKGFK
ncbi:alpha-1,3-galactosidase-related protein [Saccharicrinis aurantiacus]|uniref:alpha-1,3-galactosidase-related protein n=1 Tax=Saccharicrinis aurantiacus TaxID=1849719 RepID=UPI0009FAA324|nr:right-handed parallel beta-helix repeat-containing protein [Saccharicrinis aurantiacus]